ncbi:vacuolar import/degradation protein Vid24 [Chloropicon primus]|uniref:Vacuolar import/degradation protein Vid24 n=1 Tax=Chloropicon primus TaxID=1764295 RepID=A0A5B8MMN6_9CHLO|nr:vacuolar import/degradation protein Vid24 [Chloropicon primus]UPR00868.1 vacuolar import/degradation protein Vid24 [Chloropicon primus]|mmetsp:Transcript_13590/g.38227  ORF Transcript_13590/g.38227 Transcript_13590/m.38227 type:complete len:350 (-) Transcript_13590:454-1503(-)|eukprot:QDZ21657.1 vacuolar import/degradation protein Vid24 [Chloropicon primus]
MAAMASELMSLDEELTENMRRYRTSTAYRASHGGGYSDATVDLEALLRSPSEAQDSIMMSLDDACAEMEMPELDNSLRAASASSSLGMLVFSTLQNLRGRQDLSTPVRRGVRAVRQAAYQAARKKERRGGLTRVDLSTENFSRRTPLQPCTFLEPGMTFEGVQRVSSSSSPSESWDLKITVEERNFAKGYVCGTMYAKGFNCGSGESEPVATFWEGQLIDNVNYSFYTQNWGASKAIDREHWTKLAPFSDIFSNSEEGGKVADHNNAQEPVDLANQPYIYMRLKEKYFLNDEPGGNLTIAGFYYLCISRATGEMTGYYFDPNSTPFQRVSLQVTYEGSRGFISAGGDLI